MGMEFYGMDFFSTFHWTHKRSAPYFNFFFSRSFLFRRVFSFLLLLFLKIPIPFRWRNNYILSFLSMKSGSIKKHRIPTKCDGRHGFWKMRSRALGDNKKPIFLHFSHINPYEILSINNIHRNAFVITSDFLNILNICHLPNTTLFSRAEKITHGNMLPRIAPIRLWALTRRRAH